MIELTVEENRLYSAAPKMLAALKTAGFILSGLPITRKNDEVWAAYSQVINAIAAATVAPTTNHEGTER